jgi:transposase-like protein
VQSILEDFKFPPAEVHEERVMFAAQVGTEMLHHADVQGYYVMVYVASQPSLLGVRAMLFSRSIVQCAATNATAPQAAFEAAT